MQHALGRKKYCRISIHYHFNGNFSVNFYYCVFLDVDRLPTIVNATTEVVATAAIALCSALQFVSDETEFCVPALVTVHLSLIYNSRLTSIQRPE
jgi:hypothetical protein